MPTRPPRRPTHPAQRPHRAPQPTIAQQAYDLTARVRDLIEEFGYAVISVPADPATANPAFTYTVGLRLLAPHLGYELVQIGLPYNLAKPLLHRTVDHLADTHTTPAQNLQLPRIADPYDARLHRAQDCSLFLGGMRTLATPDPQVWQVLFPDRRHAFPGDPHYPADQLRAQPLL